MFRMHVLVVLYSVFGLAKQIMTENGMLVLAQS